MGRDGDLLQRLSDHIPWQGEVDRAARLVERELQGTVDDRFQLRRLAQLVVPLDILPHHPGLIVALLRPLDVNVARAAQAPVVRQR